MKRTVQTGIALILVGLLGACTSSKKAESDMYGMDEAPVVDAGTDAVPMNGAEEATTASDSLNASTDSRPSETPSAASEAPAAMAESSPSESATPPAESAASPESGTGSPMAASSGDKTSYTVQSGDTLMKIAFEVYGDLYQWRKIYDDNRDKIPNPNALVKGTQLMVEKTSVTIEKNGEQYLIKRGDTLGTISDDVYGTNRKWKKLWENNKQLIKDPNKIYAGFYLYYVMSDDDRREADELKKGKGAPMAQAPAAEPAAPRQPAANAPTQPAAQ